MEGGGGTKVKGWVGGRGGGKGLDGRGRGGKEGRAQMEIPIDGSQNVSQGLFRRSLG